MGMVKLCKPSRGGKAELPGATQVIKARSFFASSTVHIFKGDFNSAMETLNMFYSWVGMSFTLLEPFWCRPQNKTQLSSEARAGISHTIAHSRSSPLVQLLIQVSFYSFWLEAKRIASEVYAALLSIHQCQVSCGGKPQKHKWAWAQEGMYPLRAACSRAPQGAMGPRGAPSRPSSQDTTQVTSWKGSKKEYKCASIYFCCISAILGRVHLYLFWSECEFRQH